MYFPIAGFVWLASNAWRVEAKGRRAHSRETRRFVQATIAGFAMALIPVAVYFSIAGAFDDFLWNTFVYPFVAPNMFPLAEKTLVRSFYWFVLRSAPLLPLSLLGLTFTPLRMNNSLKLGLIAWLVTALLAFAIQGRWWEYHLMTFIIPLGILAGQGAKKVFDELTRESCGVMRRLSLVGAMGLLFLPALGNHSACVLAFVRRDFCITASSRLGFQSDVDFRYAKIVEETSFLRNPAAKQGPIYALGDPTIIHAAKRRQALGMSGWFADSYVAWQWEWVRTELHSGKAKYVFIADYIRPIVAIRQPSILQLLEHDFEKHHRTLTGEWFVLKN